MFFLPNVFFMFFIIGYKTCFLMFFYSHIDVFYNYGGNISETVQDRDAVTIQSLTKAKERIVLSEIHFRTTGRHLSMGSHSVICHPTEVTAPPSLQPGRLVLDLSTP